MVHRVTTSHNEWYKEWQRVVQRVTTNDNDWKGVMQRVTTIDTTSDNKWQRMTTSGTTNENEWKRMRTTKREWFWFQNETIYAMYNYNIFSIIDQL